MEDIVIINCDECVMQATHACDDCIVSVLLGHGAGPIELGTDEAEALDHLADAGLVAPLRLVRRDRGPDAATG